MGALSFTTMVMRLMIHLILASNAFLVASTGVAHNPPLNPLEIVSSHLHVYHRLRRTCIGTYQTSKHHNLDALSQFI